MRLSFGEFVFDTDKRVLERSSAVVPLSPKAFAVLEVLASERPRAVAKSVLLDRVWPGTAVEEQNVKNAVVELRAALAEERESIRTIRGFGYAFDAVPQASGARLVAPRITHWLSVGENIIGRTNTCSLVLIESGVSREHARLRVHTDGRTTLEDLGSKNGTFVNDRRITSAVSLDDGDAVRFGVVKLVFRSRRRDRTTTLP